MSVGGGRDVHVCTGERGKEAAMSVCVRGRWSDGWWAGGRDGRVWQGSYY